MMLSVSRTVDREFVNDPVHCAGHLTVDVEVALLLSDD